MSMHVERLSVETGHPHVIQGFAMPLRRIPLVPLEAVPGVSCRITYHHRVAGHLCQDRGRRDAEHLPIALHDRLLRPADLRDAASAIDEDERPILRGQSQAPY